MPNDIGHDNPKINNLVNMIADGGVKIPPLQRPFVWKPNQIIELLESIYNDYPIGSILCWETSEKLTAERNIAGFKLPDKPETHPFFYVLDGQQRLSTLYGVFSVDRTIGEEREEYKVNHDVFEILFDLDALKFIHKSDKIDGNNYLSLKGLFDPEQYSSALLATNDKAKRQTITALYTKFTNYEVPILITKKRTFEEVGNIFERVNNTGTKLDLFDLMVALTWTPDFHLQNEFKQIHNLLDKKNFKGIKNKILLQCISVMLNETCKTKAITKLKGENVRQNVKTLIEALKKTIDFLYTEIKVCSRSVLPHAHQIIPLCYFFSKVTTPSADQVKAIKKWFWKTTFSARYSSGTDTSVDEDIVLFKKLIEDSDWGCFDKLRYSISDEQLKDTKFLKTNPFSRGFVVLLANKNPLNLVNAGRIDLGEALSSFNKREYHHVFPEAFLKTKNVENDKINSLCNFCLLPSDSNKKISDRAPSDYFFNEIPEDQYKAILDSNILPLKQDTYKKDSYGVFLTDRAKKIIEYIDEQLI